MTACVCLTAGLLPANGAASLSCQLDITPSVSSRWIYVIDKK